MEFESVHNYYERQVLEYLIQELGNEYGADRLADVACVALNHLPPRYIRHDVDMTFYLSPQEATEIRNKIAQACQDAITYVNRRDSKKSS